MSASSEESGSATPNYGGVDYWDDRYGNWAPQPYDWLFEYEHVSGLISQFVNKSDKIFVPGCGNAPLTPNLYKDGYCDQVNCDTSVVVIDQMKEWHGAACPKAEFNVMDATSTPYADGHFDSIIDKSLIDTLVCVKDGENVTHGMVDEFYRILKPGGFYITFSLHTVDQIAKFFRNRKQHRSYQWTHSGVMVMNSNYGKSDSGASQAYAVMVCQKHGGDGVPRVDIAAKLASFEAKLDPEEEKRLKAEADQARKETERRAAAEFLMALKHAHSQGHIAVEERNWFKDELVTKKAEADVLLSILHEIVAKNKTRQLESRS